MTVYGVGSFHSAMSARSNLDNHGINNRPNLPLYVDFLPVLIEAPAHLRLTETG